MEARTSDDNHLDSNVLLPPRKRLLACMKKRNGDSNGNSFPPSTSMSTFDFETRLDKLLSARLSDNNHSHEEIVAAARSAAEAAVKIAKAARAAAQKKEVKASVAMAAAKKALELVAAIDEKETSSYVEQQQSKKNKTTTEEAHVQMLFDDKQPRVENGKTSDNEELARHLHQPTNNSPQNLKRNSSVDLKEVPIVSESGRVVNGSVVVDETSSAKNRIKLTRYNVDKNATKIKEKGKKFREEDPSSSLGRKRGKMKQTKLPLSICGDRDRLNPKKNCRRRSTESVGENKGEKMMFSVGHSAISITPVERNSLWKCKSFKSAARLEQNKGYHDVPIAYHNNSQLQ